MKNQRGPPKNASALPFYLNLDLTFHATFVQMFLMVCIICNLVAILITLLNKNRCKRKSFGCQLCINFSDDRSSSLVRSQILGDIAANYEFYCDTFISDVAVRYFYNPKVVIDWQLQVVHSYAERAIKFQRQTSISFAQARELRGILKTESFLTVSADHKRVWHNNATPDQAKYRVPRTRSIRRYSAKYRTGRRRYISVFEKSGVKSSSDKQMCPPKKMRT